MTASLGDLGYIREQTCLSTLLGENGDALRQIGCVEALSGGFATQRAVGSFHSDFGPLKQDKETNQDYALLWVPHADQREPPAIEFVLAFADGVSNADRAELAAELACWVAVRSLAEASSDQEPRARAIGAFNAAVSAIRSVAGQIIEQPEATWSPDRYRNLSLWKYKLKKGEFLQTTLTLLWISGGVLHLAAIGDAGILCRRYYRGLAVHPVKEKPEKDEVPQEQPRRPWPLSLFTSRKVPHSNSCDSRPDASPFRVDANAVVSRTLVDTIIANCDLEDQRVVALGPDTQGVTSLEHWYSEAVSGPFLLAAFTDGIGRGIGDNAFGLLDELESLLAEDPEAAAQRYITTALERHPERFDDNLTLVVISGREVPDEEH